jgi:hypothetical protein
MPAHDSVACVLQTLIVNGSEISETDAGDYYPYWLYQVVTAVFDPVPFAAWLRQTKQEIAEPSGGAHERVCGDLHFRLDRIIVCFDGCGRLESVFSKGYFAEFREYQKFGGKQVARRVVTEPEYKSEIEARNSLRPATIPVWTNPLHEALLKWKLKQAVVDGIPVQVTALMGFPFKLHVEPAPAITQLSNEEARKLAANKVDPVFPSGAPHGTKVQVNISVDDDGTLLGSGPGANQDSKLFFPAYNAVAQWKFSPYVENGKAVPFKAAIIFIVP